MSITEIVDVDLGWRETFAIPKREHAEQYILISKELGYEVQPEPVKTTEGWIVKWRQSNGRGSSEEEKETDS